MNEFTPILFYQIDVDIPRLTEEDFDELENVDAPEANMMDYNIIYNFLVKGLEDTNIKTKK